MIEYIKRLKDVEVDELSVRAPNAWEMMEKINEIIDYLNCSIEAGKMMPPEYL